MKKILIFFLTTTATLLVILFVGFYFYAGPKLKNLIEEKGSSALGAIVKTESVSLSFWPVLGVSIKQLTFDKKDASELKVVIPETVLHLEIKDLFKLSFGISVTLTKPDVLFTAAQAKLGADGKVAAIAEYPNNNGTRSVTLPVFNTATPLSADIEIVDGWLKVNQGQNHIEMQIPKASASLPTLNGPLALKIIAENKVDWGGFKANIPLTLAGHLALQGPVISTKDLQISLGGLGLNLQGSDDLLSQKQDWTATVNISDLSSLPELNALPLKSLKGGVAAQIRATKDSAISQWVAVGIVHLNKLSGLLNYQTKEQMAKGFMSLDLESEFNFKDSLSFTKLLVDLDLSKAALSYGDHFRKPENTILKLSIDAKEAGQVLTLRQAILSFANLNAKANGTIAAASGQTSNLNILVNRTPLNGFERFFPAIASYPLQGFVELNANLKGDLQNPENLTIDLNPLELSHVRGVFNWKSQDLSKQLVGPAVVDVRTVIRAQGKNLISALIKADADLTSMNINIEKQFEKKAGAPLKIEVSAQKKGDAIQISRFLFSSIAGSVTLSGLLKNPQEPVMNLQMLAPKIDLTQLSRLIPMLVSYHLAGNVSCKLLLNGKYNFKDGIEKSPLTLTGQISANLPTFKYASQKPQGGGQVAGAQASGGQAPTGSQPKTGLAPSWPILKNLNLLLSAKLETLIFNDLQVSGIDSTIKIAGGMIQGSAKVRQIFSGSINADSFSIPLFIIEPTTKAHLSVSSMALEQALTWATPQWRDLAKGRISATLLMNIAYPSRADFIDATTIQGDAKITNGYLSTLQFDKYINEKLSKLPGIGNSSQVKSGGANANIDSVFDFNKSVLNFKTLHVFTPDRNELKVSGYVKVDKHIDLQGNAYIANAPVSGPVMEANSDSTGRFILPVHFTGLVTNPELNITQETLQKIASNTAGNETKKLKAQLQGRAQQEIKKQQDSLKNQLQDEAKKKLQNLFGQ